MRTTLNILLVSFMMGFGSASAELALYSATDSSITIRTNFSEDVSEVAVVQGSTEVVVGHYDTTTFGNLSPGTEYHFSAFSGDIVDSASFSTLPKDFFMIYGTPLIMKVQPATPKVGDLIEVTIKFPYAAKMVATELALLDGTNLMLNPEGDSVSATFVLTEELIWEGEESEKGTTVGWFFVDGKRVPDGMIEFPLELNLEEPLLITSVDYTPTDYQLSQNYPNPFNPTTTINYSLAKQGNVTVTVYNKLGQYVTTLVDMQQAPGRYSVSWDGITYNGVPVSSGTYFYRIQAGDFIETRTMTLTK